jgi:hypothetical protein
VLQVGATGKRESILLTERDDETVLVWIFMVAVSNLNFGPVGVYSD